MAYVAWEQDYNFTAMREGAAAGKGTQGDTSIQSAGGGKLPRHLLSLFEKEETFEHYKTT